VCRLEPQMQFGMTALKKRANRNRKFTLARPATP